MVDEFATTSVKRLVVLKACGGITAESWLVGCGSRGRGWAEFLDSESRERMAEEQGKVAELRKWFIGNKLKPVGTEQSLHCPLVLQMGEKRCAPF